MGIRRLLKHFRRLPQYRIRRLLKRFRRPGKSGIRRLLKRFRRPGKSGIRNLLKRLRGLVQYRLHHLFLRALDKPPLNKVFSDAGSVTACRGWRNMKHQAASQADP